MLRIFIGRLIGLIMAFVIVISFGFNNMYVCMLTGYLASMAGMIVATFTDKNI